MIQFFQKTELRNLTTGREITVKRAGIAAYFSLISSMLAMGEIRERMIRQGKDGDLAPLIAEMLATEREMSATLAEFYIEKPPFSPSEVPELVKLAIEFNRRPVDPEEKPKGIRAKSSEMESAAVRVTAILAEKTGWTVDYLAERVSFREAQDLLDVWKETRVSAIVDTAIAFGGNIHDHINGILGIREISLEDYAEEMRAKYGETIPVQ